MINVDPNLGYAEFDPYSGNEKESRFFKNARKYADRYDFFGQIAHSDIYENGKSVTFMGANPFLWKEFAGLHTGTEMNVVPIFGV